MFTILLKVLIQIEKKCYILFLNFSILLTLVWALLNTVNLYKLVSMDKTFDFTLLTSYYNFQIL